MNERNSPIRDIEPKFDDNGNIIPKQDYCASCKFRIDCPKLKSIINEKVLTCSTVLASMYHICDDFEPIYIQFPIMVEQIVSDSSFDKYNQQTNIGDWCAVSVQEEGYSDELHLGILLGVLPVSIISLFDTKHGIIRNTFNSQPAIYVPYFKKVFYALNMKWQLITKEKDLQAFSDTEPMLQNAKEFFSKI